MAFSVGHDPWIPVLDLEGEAREVSIVDALGQAHRIRRLACEVASQDVGILRLLLAVLLRATSGERSDRWRQAEAPPAELVAEYLGAWDHRLRVDDPVAPFLQTPGLRSVSGRRSGLGALVSKMLTPPPVALSVPAAARWLVHVHAFDPSGIRAGLVGDPETIRAKGMPRGSGWAGRGTHAIIDPGSLWRTLALLAVPQPDESLPAWEAPPAVPGDRGEQPRGRCEVLTWQSRRVLLTIEGGRVVDCVVGQGDRVEAAGPLRDVDPTLTWAKREGGGWVPVRVSAQPDWRVLARVLGEGAPAAMEGWGDAPPTDRSAEVVIVTSDLGSTGSKWVDLRAGRVVVDPSLLGHGGRGLLAEVAGLCSAAATAAGYLARDLVMAAGGDEHAQRSAYESVRELAAAEMDPPFAQWARRLGDDPLQDWRDRLRVAMDATEDQVVSQYASTAAIIGRDRPDGRRIDLGLAQIFYRAARRRICSAPEGDAADQG